MITNPEVRNVRGKFRCFANLHIYDQDTEYPQSTYLLQFWHLSCILPVNKKFLANVEFNLPSYLNPRVFVGTKLCIKGINCARKKKLLNLPILLVLTLY